VNDPGLLTRYVSVSKPGIVDVGCASGIDGKIDTSADSWKPANGVEILTVISASSLFCGA
jgi:hypothetical protein